MLRVAPFKSVRLKNTINPWINAEIVKMFYKRDFLHKKAIDKGKDSNQWTKYVEYRNKVKRTIKKAKCEYFTSKCIENKNNSRGLWKVIKRIYPSKNKNSVNCKLTANAFNKFFSSIGNTINNRFQSQSTTNKSKGSKCKYNFNVSNVSYADLHRCISNLPSSSSNDVLDFDSYLLRISADIITSYLYHIFNLSILHSYIPDDFKIARVTPVYKGKDAKDCESNYRPISITCHISKKLLEIQINKQLIEYLHKHNLITADQSAFLKNHSTQTSLHRVMDDWLQNIDDNLLTGVVYLDIEKCFDSLDHDILLNKLERYGMNTKWFKNYLCNRKQFVRFNDELSEIRTTNIGVPQGSVLGPLLFLVYVNDLSQNVGNDQLNMYADDAVIYTSGKTVNELNDKLLKSMATVTKWYGNNKLAINTNKSSTMLIHSTHKTLTDELQVEINNKMLENVESCKYIGVTVD